MALLHFTGPSAVGGVEMLVEAQLRFLRQEGIRTRLITGNRDASVADSSYCISAMHPNVAEHEAQRLASPLPPPNHPLVRSLVAELTAALEGYTDCWIHNALTTYLNPFLTAALRTLIPTRPHVRWVAWCEDVSTVSAFWRAKGAADSLNMIPLGVRVVTISQARRSELAREFSLAESDIAVIPPPLDVLDLIGAEEQTRALVAALGLIACFPVVLVPAKLLPHKNLRQCVELAAQLEQMMERPLVLITGAPSPHEPQVSAETHQTLLSAVAAQKVRSLHLLSDVVGDLERKSIAALMLLSDLVFLPSLEEGFGMPLLEAAALRVPVLCTDLPAFRETNPSAHFFPPAADAGQLARTVMEIVSKAPNQARLRAVRSIDRFETQLRDLLERSP